MSRRVVNFNGLASVSSVWGYMVCNDKRWYEKHAQFLQGIGHGGSLRLSLCPSPSPSCGRGRSRSRERARLKGKLRCADAFNELSSVEARRLESSQVEFAWVQSQPKLSSAAFLWVFLNWVFFLCCLFKHNRTTNFYLIFTIYLTTDTVETSYRWSKLQ